MNKQRKVLITITYNEMGIIIDTKAEKLGSSAQPEIIPCDYVKACNEATNYKMISAVSYLEVLEELKKHGYVLVDTIKER